MDHKLLKKIGIITSAIVIIPIIIHILYKIPQAPDWLVTSWTAGDMLSYVGSIICAASTIYVMYETIQEQKENRIQSMCPQLQFENVSIENQSVDKQECTLQFYRKKEKEKYQYAHVIEVAVTIVISNIGAGNALNVMAHIYEKDISDGFTYDLKPLIVNDSYLLKIVISSYNYDEDPIDRLKLDIEYHDSGCLRRYRSSITISITNTGGAKNHVVLTVPESHILN